MLYWRFQTTTSIRSHFAWYTRRSLSCPWSQIQLPNCYHLACAWLQHAEHQWLQRLKQHQSRHHHCPHPVRPWSTSCKLVFLALFCSSISTRREELFTCHHFHREYILDSYTEWVASVLQQVLYVPLAGPFNCACYCLIIVGDHDLSTTDYLTNFLPSFRNNVRTSKY